MRLIQARVQHFKSVDDSGSVTIDAAVTVLVAQNEAGKTAFLQALEKARPVRTGVTFDVTEDYPRKSVNEYRRRHWFEHLGLPPRFLYFGDYQLLPGKVNLTTLQQRVSTPAQLTDEDQTALRLLAMQMLTSPSC